MPRILWPRTGRRRTGYSLVLGLGSHLSRASSPDSLGAGPLDWLGNIIRKMKSGAPDCEAFARGNAEVRFVTFNFDSIIEDRFEKAIRNLYRASQAPLQQNRQRHSRPDHPRARPVTAAAALPIEAFVRMDRLALACHITDSCRPRPDRGRHTGRHSASCKTLGSLVLPRVRLCQGESDTTGSPRRHRARR